MNTMKAYALNGNGKHVMLPRNGWGWAWAVELGFLAGLRLGFGLG